MREWQKKLLMLMVSIIGTYAILEFAVWRRMLDRIPLSLQSELGRLGPFGQTSKSGLEPKDYVALIGDSYVEGLGDWLMRVVRDGNPRYNAAHVLHDLTDRDVISFAVRGGYPSFNVNNMFRTYTGANLYAGLSLADPADIVVVFFAGNDINDEIAALKRSPPDRLERIAAGDWPFALSLVRENATSGIKGGARRWNWFRNAHLMDTAGKLTKLALKNARSGTIFTNDDAIRKIGADYVEDWSRYQNAETFFISKGEHLPYAKDSVEPFAFHTSSEIDVTGLILRAVLTVYREHFPNARIWLAHVPSPIMTYRLADVSVVLYDRIREANTERQGPPTAFATSALLKQSDAICEMALLAAERAQAGFIDTAPYLRMKSEQEGHLHGPNDPSHFNERGYKAFGEVLAAGLAGKAPQPCALAASSQP
jgi:hypothetical protein